MWLGFTAGAVVLVGDAVELREDEGHGGAVWRRVVLPVDLGVAMTRGALWHGRCARKGPSAAVWSRQAGAEGCVGCGGHGAASPRGRVGLLHGGDPCGRAPRTAMAWRRLHSTSGVN